MYNLIEEIKIKDIIYEIRGKKVMLDTDLAKLYGYKSGAKALNQAVKRNIERFPEDFSFELTKEEYKYLMINPNFLRSQIVTSKEEKRGGIRYFPRVFTQEGIAMLSGIIKTKEAVSILLVTDGIKSNINKTDIEKFNSEYPKLDIKYTNVFHDRFIILDKIELYHLGASLKDLGKKVFGITKINEEDTLYSLINKLNSMKS